VVIQPLSVNTRHTMWKRTRLSIQWDDRWSNLTNEKRYTCLFNGMGVTYSLRKKRKPKKRLVKKLKIKNEIIITIHNKKISLFTLIFLHYLTFYMCVCLVLYFIINLFEETNTRVCLLCLSTLTSMINTNVWHVASKLTQMHLED
jgi:hypothetical protein